MTPEGLKNRYKILTAVFSYLELMRKEGVPQFLAPELRLMSDLSWRFQVKDTHPSGVVVFSSFWSGAVSPIGGLVVAHCLALSWPCLTWGWVPASFVREALSCLLRSELTKLFFVFVFLGTSVRFR